MDGTYLREMHFIFLRLFKFDLNFNVIKNHNIIGSIKLKLQPWDPSDHEMNFV